MPSKFQEMLKKQRSNPETSRAGLKWNKEEDDQLLNMVAENDTIPNIAKFLQRTEGSIKTRLILYAINKMQKDNLSLEQVAELVKLSVDDITEYQKKKDEKAEKTQQYRRSEEVSLTDIYSLLQTMKKQLDALSK